MDRKELKNKIVNLFCETFVKYPDDADHYEHWREHIADALIAAGIGDVSELQKECDSKEESYNKCYLNYKYWKDTAKEYKHRAARAERALREACSRAWSIECTCPSIFEDNDECSECYKNQSEKRYEEKDAIDCLSKKLLEQAEKELAEERKDD